MVSAGAACSSGKVKPSRGARRHGVGRPGRRGRCALRGGWDTTEHDWDRFADAWLAASSTRRSRGASGKGVRLMAAVQQTIDTVKALEVDKYVHGFVTEIETEFAAQGPGRRHRALHLRQEGRAGVDAGVAAGGVRPLAGAGGAELGQDRLSARSTTRTSTTTPRPRRRRSSDSLDQVDPELLATYAKLGIPLREQEVLAGVKTAPRVAVDAVFDSVSVATTFKAELAKAGVIFMPISEAFSEHPRTGAPVPGLGGAGVGQLLRLPEQRRCSPTAPSSTCRRACAAPWSCRPISASTPRIPASSSAP